MTSIIKEWLYKPRYILIFLRRHHGTMFVMKKRTFSDIKKIMGLAEKKYVLDINTPSYVFENKYVYLLNFDTGAQLTYTEIERQMSPEELDTIVGNKIIRELTAGVMDNKKEKLMWLIFGLIMGLLIGVVIMQFVMSNKIAEITEDSIPVIPTIPTLGV